jgi:membrane protease YdiL (CAAX protease family)
MSPEPLPPAVEAYPFWGYLELGAFLLIAAFALLADAAVTGAVLSVLHVKPLFVELPAQFLLYAILLGMLALIFRRYYGRPFWQSLRWTPAALSTLAIVGRGMSLAFAVMVASLLLKTPDINSPMKELLSDRTSIILVGIFGTTLGPLCEELLFRGFLQPLLVRSWGALAGIFATAALFGLLHLQEYGNSWRHGLLIALAGAAFGWIRYSTGSTKAAAVMHSAYNCTFFLLLGMQQVVAR